MSGVGPTGVRCSPRAGSVRISTILPSTSPWSVSTCPCSAALHTSRNGTTVIGAVESTSAHPRPSTGIRMAPELDRAIVTPPRSRAIRSGPALRKAVASARPNAGTARSPSRTKSGTFRTTPSGSGAARVCPTPPACSASPGSAPASPRASGHCAPACESGSQDRCGGVAGLPAWSGASSSAIGNTTSPASAVAWLSSASLPAPPRPGALGCPSATSRPMAAAPARARLVMSRASTARSHAPAPSRAALAGSRATTMRAGLAGRGPRPRTQ